MPSRSSSKSNLDQVRCPWAGQDPLMVEYHDREWGTPVHHDRVFFEFLLLEGAQAGLSWSTILRKRAAYREAFDRFDPRKVAKYDETRIAGLLQNEGIVRNRLKIRGAVKNAIAFLAVQKEFGSFDRYVWRFVDGQPQIRKPRTTSDVPARSLASDALSKDLLKRGFTFVGSTICYAFLQATGLVNDHLAGCYRSAELDRALLAKR